MLHVKDICVLTFLIKITISSDQFSVCHLTRVLNQDRISKRQDY